MRRLTLPENKPVPMADAIPYDVISPGLCDEIGAAMHISLGRHDVSIKAQITPRFSQ
ncbi:MAG: hypothetical protein RDV48_20580 [Candidatus Eremiobacteraeota bacterium]|nr:hypothetical protein [Candidatus Eremiobacteraeota bacterium]